MWTFTSLESLRLDAAYALRMLQRQRGFTTTVVIVLAAVIGLNTTLFTVFAGIALRPWPGIADASQVVRVYLADPSGQTSGFSLADARSLAQSATSLAGIAMMKNESVRLGAGDAVTASEALMVSGNFFEVLGVELARGRGFVAAEDRPGAAAAVAVVTFAYWQGALGGSPDVVGSTLRINGVLFTIVGVVSSDFESAEPAYDKQIFLPLSSLALLRPGDPSTERFLDDSTACCADVVARLSPDATRADAHAELALLTSTFRAFSGNVARGVVVMSTEFLSQPGRRDSSQALITAVLLATGLALVWLIACANVGNLLLSRAAARAAEIATRLTLGASRWRIVRQLLTESFVLALCASALGVLVAYQLPFVLFRIVAESGTRAVFPFSVAPDGMVIVYTVVLAALSVVAFGLAPALHATRTDLVESLKRRQSFTPGSLRLRHVLLGAQVATSVVLLVSASLLMRGVQRQAGKFDPGFSVENVTTTQFELPEGIFDRTRASAFFAQLTEGIRQLPIESAAFASHEPFSRYRHGTIFHLPNESREQAQQLLFLNVSSDYFTVLGIPLRAGRYFDAGDVTRPVVIINDTMARRFWPGENPIGKTFFIRPRGPVDTMAPREIVGVVRDVQASTASTVSPLFYQPVEPGSDVLGFISRDPRASQPPTLLVKTRFDISHELARLAARIDPRVRVHVAPLSATLDAMLQTSRWGPILAATLGLFALGLATVGVFGVFAYAVRQQRHDIGIRLALGAAPRAIVQVVLAGHARPLIGGLVAGLVGSIAASLLLRHRLHGLSPFDPAAYLIVAALLVSCGVIATLLPARTATRVNPIEALREI